MMLLTRRHPATTSGTRPSWTLQVMNTQSRCISRARPQRSRSMAPSGAAHSSAKPTGPSSPALADPCTCVHHRGWSVKCVSLAGSLRAASSFAASAHVHSRSELKSPSSERLMGLLSSSLGLVRHEAEIRHGAKASLPPSLLLHALRRTQCTGWTSIQTAQHQTDVSGLAGRPEASSQTVCAGSNPAGGAHVFAGQRARWPCLSAARPPFVRRWSASP
jgi:hypothetical protein